jgi:hypothetical protein
MSIRKSLPARAGRLFFTKRMFPVRCEANGQQAVTLLCSPRDDKVLTTQVWKEQEG